jgi:hypothetical protein
VGDDAFVSEELQATSCKLQVIRSKILCIASAVCGVKGNTHKSTSKQEETLTAKVLQLEADSLQLHEKPFA